MSAARLYWLHCLTPLHVGTGRGEGYIDLHLAREKVTSLPYVPGSSVKGVFADSWGASQEKRKSDLHFAAFGKAGDDNANAGALAFTDARLVCLPVRSLYGTFAWCTSRFVLHRLTRDLGMAGVTNPPALPNPVELRGGVTAQVASKTPAITHQNRAYLEDLDFAAVDTEQAAGWAKWLAERLFAGDVAWQAEFVKRFAVLPDDLFTSLCETGTEVQPHVRIDSEQKRVADGALWYEESLPAESVLMGLVWCDEPRGVKGVTKEAVVGLCENHDGPKAVQFGGKATVGKGRTRLLFSEGKS